MILSRKHHKATEEEGDQGILAKEIGRKKCGQQDTSTAGGRRRWQHKTELDGDTWSVATVPAEATRHQSRQNQVSAFLANNKIAIALLGLGGGVHLCGMGGNTV